MGSLLGVGKQIFAFLFSFLSVLSFGYSVMDSILKGWNRFSFWDKEGDRIKLEKCTQPFFNSEVVLAAKFLNRRAFNVYAIRRAFRSLWKTRKIFNIREVGDHLFLFFFETANDTERVLRSKPWSDKHLVLFRCLNGARNVRNLNFTSTKFWVQLHGLPIDRLDIPMTIQIGKTLGMVSKLEREMDMIGGDFLQVRVEVDVSKPLCCGRKVVLDDEEEVWVSFKYEKLPNFCYWCGMVCHDDKDCDRWLSSKGSLPLNSQEFGAWMRANPFNARRKTFCSVPGVEVF